jgi:prevent-host-death family protein
MLTIPIAEAHNRLSSLLKKVQKSPILLTRRGKAVGVLIAPEEYEQLRKVQAYMQLVNVSREVREGPGAEKLYRLSREELEKRS